jgi:hypothetical protein
MVFIRGINVAYADSVHSNKKTTKPNTQNNSLVINKSASPNINPATKPEMQKKHYCLAIPAANLFKRYPPFSTILK